jgi:hypothetical protein
MELVIASAAVKRRRPDRVPNYNGLFLNPGDGLCGVDRRPRRRALSQGQQPLGDASFGEIEAAQENAGLAADRIGDDLVMGKFVLQCRSYDALLDVEELEEEPLSCAMEKNTLYRLSS